MVRKSKKRRVSEFAVVGLLVVLGFLLAVLLTPNGLHNRIRDSYVHFVSAEEFLGTSGSPSQVSQVSSLSCGSFGVSHVVFNRCVNPDTGSEYALGSNIWCMNYLDSNYGVCNESGLNGFLCSDSSFNNSVVHSPGYQVKYLRRDGWLPLSEHCVYTQRCDGIITYSLPSALMNQYNPVVTKFNVSDPDSVFNVSNNRYVGFMVTPMCFTDVPGSIFTYLTVPDATGEGYAYPVWYVVSHGMTCKSSKRIYSINVGSDLNNVVVNNGVVDVGSADNRYKLCW